MIEALDSPDADLAGWPERLAAWPETDQPIARQLATAAAEAALGHARLREALAAPDGVRAAYRALRHLPRAEAALWPLAALLLPLSRLFLEGRARTDTDLVARLARPPAGSGVRHPVPGRGGHSLYIPELAAPPAGWPVVLALHGGSGHGPAFLWSWLRAARGRGVMVIAPTSVAETWSFGGEDQDLANLTRILEAVRAEHPIDPARLLLTGMSDGGTYTHLRAFEGGLPATHYAPISAAFHPMLSAIAEPARMAGMKVRLLHGARDWMFPPSLAEQARDAYRAAGADADLAVIDGLSHVFPRDHAGALLDWLIQEPRP